MEKIIGLIIISFSFLISSCCTFSNFQQPQAKEVTVRLEIIDSIVTTQEPIAKLKVYLMNNSNTTISILANLYRDWHPIVLYGDSIRYDLQSFIEFVVPSCSDYIEIGPSKEISFTFDFDISDYASEKMMFRGKNIDYGNYSIELLYKDEFVKCCNAVSAPIYSNEVNLIYNKN
ncbi:MAG: hypothetical protein IT277_04490 [Ignavibacteriaceae bacterium]|jgi:hypothetical protein|nr:hypothetical protein [Ignavibacteriaceae bacterium]